MIKEYTELKKEEKKGWKNVNRKKKKKGNVFVWLYFMAYQFSLVIECYILFINIY